MDTVKKFYTLDEEVEVLLTKKKGMGRKRFGTIEGELVRVITIKTTGGKKKTYTDVIKKFKDKSKLGVKGIFASFKFRIPLKKHQNVTSCVGKKFKNQRKLTIFRHGYRMQILVQGNRLPQHQAHLQA